MIATLSLALAFAADRFSPEADVRAYSATTSSWRKINRADPNTLIDLTVVLQAPGRDALEKTFWAVSTPTNPAYGQHKKLDEIAAILAVPQERVDRVKAHFGSATSLTLSPTRDMLKVRMPVAAAERALACELHAFDHPSKPGKLLVRASTHYSLPSSLADDVVMVGELMQFPAPRARLGGDDDAATSPSVWPNDCEAAQCSGKVTPGVLAARYKTNASVGMESSSSTMAVAEFQGEFFEERDLESFGASCHVPCDVKTVVGANRSQAGTESELDIEYIKAVAPEVPLTVVYSNQYSLLDWANEITSNASSPLIHSVSYGNDEAQQTGTPRAQFCAIRRNYSEDAHPPQARRTC